MPTVETTGGPVDVEELGLTLIHEHFKATDEGGRVQFPHLYNEQRDWDVAVADESGLNIVLATGVYTYDHLPQFLLNRDEDGVAAIFVHDIENGIQDTGI